MATDREWTMKNEAITVISVIEKTSKYITLTLSWISVFLFLWLSVEIAFQL